MKKQPQIQINLINYKLEKKMSRQSMLLEWSVYLLVGLLIVGGIFLFNRSLHGKIEALNQENKVLQAELKAISVDTSTIGNNQKIVAAIKTRSLLVNSLLKQQKDYVPVYDELGQLNDSGIIFSNIDVQNGVVNVQGYANNHAKLVALLQTLRDSELFGDPANLQLSTAEDTREISFTMQMGLQEVK